MNISTQKDESPRSATNTSGLSGAVYKGLPNHLNPQRLGEDGECYHQFAGLGPVKALQRPNGGGYEPAPSEGRSCVCIHAPPVWPVGVGVFALAVPPWADDPVRVM